jgi:hypothetical protein
VSIYLPYSIDLPNQRLEHFKTLFRVQATHTGPKRREVRSDGQQYFVASWDVVILFGLTEVRAQIRWDENVRSLLYIAGFY